MTDNATPAEGYSIQIPAPGIPYSAVRIPMDGDFEWALARLEEFMKAYQAKFGGHIADEAMQHGGTPVQGPQNAPQRANGQQTGHRPAQGARRARQGTGLWCEEHNAELLKTTEKYDKTGDKFYHPLPESEWYQNERGLTVKNCNLWRSQAAERVPAGGRSRPDPGGKPPDYEPGDLPF